MKELDSAEKDDLRKMSVQDIESMYRKHVMSRQEKDVFLREKARVSLEDLISEKGTGMAMVNRMTTHMDDAWKKIKDIATRDTSEEGVSGALYESGRAMLALMQMYGAATEGVGEVLGMNAENAALSMGVSPGLARKINVLAWVLPQIIPVGAAAQVATNVGRKVLPKVTKGLAKEAAEGALTKETRAELMALREIADGLVDEGIPNARALMEQSARAAGKTEIADGLKAATKEVAKETSEVVAKPVAQMPAPLSFKDEAAKWAGGVTKEEARAALPNLMRKFGVSRADLRTMAKQTPGQNLTATQFYGILKAMESRGVEMSRLARAAVAEGATDADKLNFTKYATQLLTGETEKPAITHEFKELLRHWDPERVADGDIFGAMNTFAQDIAALSRNQAGKLVRRAQGPTLGMGFGPLGGFSWGQTKEFVSNMLLPLATPAAVMSNSIGTGYAIVERATGGSIPQAFYFVQGLKHAAADGMRGGLLAYQVGGMRNQIPGKAGRIINGAGRDTLIANDTAFKQVLARAYLYAEGARMAELMGIPRGSMGRFVRAFADNPPQQFIEPAFEFAKRGTFNNDLGWVGRHISQAAQSGPGYLWYTFMTSQVNLAKYAWHRTPGLQMLSRQLYTDIAAGGVRADNAMARLTIGWLQGLYWWEMAKEGLITGSGPADPDLMRVWRANNEPYTWKTSPTDNAGIPMNRLDPAIHTIGFIADMQGIWDQLDELGMQKASVAIAMSVVHNFVDRMPARTLMDMMEVISKLHNRETLNPSDLRILNNPLLGFGTGGPLVSRTARIIDPVARDQNTFANAYKSRIPFWSKTVPPLRDGFLDPVIPPASMGTPWLGYFDPLVPKIYGDEKNPIKKEGLSLNARAPYYGKTIGKGEAISEMDVSERQKGDPSPVMLDEFQRDRWQQIARNYLYGDGSEENPGIQKELLDDEDYKKQSWPERRARYNAYLSKIKSKAAKALIAEDPRLAEQYITNDIRHDLEMSTPQEQEEIMATAKSDITEYLSDQLEERENLLKWGVYEPDQQYKKPTVEILGINVGGGQQYTPTQKVLEQMQKPAIPAMPPAGPATPRSQ